MSSSLPSWARFVIVTAVVWHVLALLSPAWVKASKETHGRDFASYYYAVQVAASGEDPYVKANLDAASRLDKTRKSVFPFFYPPTFLAPMIWVQAFDLVSAYRLWFWLDELFLLALALALWRWWQPLGQSVPVVIVGVLGLLTAIPNNHVMGQVNIPVLTLVIGGLYVAKRPERRARALGGSLLGLACMMKMSPALVVGWCLLKRRYMVVMGACLTALLLSLVTLPLVDFETQVRFYTEVLPRFGNGDYNGLSVPIGMFGNHSIPNIVHQFAGGGRTLSAASSMVSTVINGAVIVGLGWTFRAPCVSRWHEAAQLAAVCAAMLLVPVYTYEHHMIWLIPAAVVCVAAICEAQLSVRWVVPVGAAVAVWSYELASLKQMWLDAGGAGTALGVVVQELKFVALLVLLLGSIRLSVLEERRHGVGAEAADGE